MHFVPMPYQVRVTYISKHFSLIRNFLFNQSRLKRIRVGLKQKEKTQFINVTQGHPKLK